MSAGATQTVLEALCKSLAVLQRSPDGEAPPVALLWTDADGQWLPLMPLLRKTLPQLHTLGPYQAEQRSGPVVWLRCVVDRSLPNALPPEAVPIIYLPNVGRQTLRAGGDCPRELQPLIELQYRGTVWHQRNGRDWTVEAFLASDMGCGLDVATDARTQAAMLRALSALAVEPLAVLRGRHLEADDFDRLTIGDPVRDLLSWMSDPQGFESRCDPARWSTFCDVCRRQFGIDPDAQGPQAAGDAMANCVGEFAGKWSQAWLRFTEAPASYSGLSALLHKAQPQGLLTDHERLPAENRAAEDILRGELGKVCSLAHAAGCERVLALEAKHGKRRDWVWRRLGESPLAVVLAPLAKLADAARTTLGGTSAQAMTEAYAAQGWMADRAAVEALASPVPASDTALLAKLVRVLYEPWLDRSARRFQELLANADMSTLATGVMAEKGCCVLFTDGLRYDVGLRLHERLEARGLQSRLTHRVAPLPTVTATAKPMASPAHAVIAGATDEEEFNPTLTADGKPVTARRLRGAMAQQGVEILAPDEVRFAGNEDAGGWTEIGRLDELGHLMGIRLVTQIEIEIEAIAERIESLLNAGWHKVRVVTDHGWLLLPGTLPKVEMPHYLAASRWARCATVKGESTTQIPTYPWYWNSDVRIASPPGIGSFFAGNEYAHGGVSLQECVVPELTVERGQVSVDTKLVSLTWRGMRCKVTVAPFATGLRVDLRLNWKQADSSIAMSAKDIADDGEASLVCADDDHEGAAAMVVLVDSGGRVLDYKPTTVGDES